MLSQPSELTPTLELKIAGLTQLYKERQDDCTLTLDEHVLIVCDKFVLLDSFKRVITIGNKPIANSDYFDYAISNPRSRGRYSNYDRQFYNQYILLTYDKDLLYYHNVIGNAESSFIDVVSYDGIKIKSSYYT
jgi:hypothetical protein